MFFARTGKIFTGTTLQRTVIDTMKLNRRRGHERNSCELHAHASSLLRLSEKKKENDLHSTSP